MKLISTFVLKSLPILVTANSKYISILYVDYVTDNAQFIYTWYELYIHVLLQPDWMYMSSVKRWGCVLKLEVEEVASIVMFISNRTYICIAGTYV